MSDFLDSLSFRVKEKETDKKEYAWEISKEKELWIHSGFETVSECVKDYLENYAGENPPRM